jgi:phenylpropionate dioxygenase-like ring-hydroxylating dioxygenase large terminal subunit
MYINFWYPVCIADDLAADAPVRARILGLDFAAFRDEAGSAHVLSDTCIHRGGSLSKGKIVNGNVACPYHGWQFSGSGKCASMPNMMGGGKIPARAKVDSYPVIERYGIVFAFLGDLPEDERPPLCEIREWDQPGWRASGLTTLDLNAYYERSIENGLDPVHNEFVHDLQGNIRFRADRMSLTTDDWGTEVYIRMDPPEKGTTQLEHLREDDKPENFGAYTRHHGANALITTIMLSKDNSFVQYFFEQPVDANHTRIFFINMRNCMLEEDKDSYMQKINLAIAAEDVAVISELYPVRTPATTTKELLTLGDECILAYRDSLQDWENRGWRIDHKAVQKCTGDIAYAIPSPERRSEKNWVLDTIPLMAENTSS